MRYKRSRSVSPRGSMLCKADHSRCQRSKSAERSSKRYQISRTSVKEKNKCSKDHPYDRISNRACCGKSRSFPRNHSKSQPELNRTETREIKDLVASQEQNISDDTAKSKVENSKDHCQSVTIFLKECEADPDTKLFTYEEGKLRIDIFKKDVLCLQPEMYLNDTIIYFFLQYILRKNASKFHPDGVKIFDPSFFTSLATEDPEFKLKARYEKVKSFTRRQDIFNLHMIIVPIVLKKHWLLLLYHPGSEKEKDPMNQKIILFDSKKDYLQDYHEAIFACFKEYLVKEWEEKKGITCHLFEEFENILPFCPQQPNTWDCGVYTLLYFQTYILTPYPNIDFAEIINLKNEDLVKKRKKLLEEIKINVNRC